MFLFREASLLGIGPSPSGGDCVFRFAQGAIRLPGMSMKKLEIRIILGL